MKYLFYWTCYVLGWLCFLASIWLPFCYVEWSPRPHFLLGYEILPVATFTPYAFLYPLLFWGNGLILSSLLAVHGLSGSLNWKVFALIIILLALVEAPLNLYSRNMVGYDMWTASLIFSVVSVWLRRLIVPKGKRAVIQPDRSSSSYEL